VCAGELTEAQQGQARAQAEVGVMCTLYTPLYFNVY
jgi:hypothetical protein